MHTLSRLMMASVAAAAGVCTATGQPFVDSSQAELIKAAPELSALAFDSGQSTLNPLLIAAGQQLERTFTKFVNVSMAEELHELRFESAHLIWKEHRDRFRYVLEARPFAELRRQAEGPDAAQPSAKSAFLIAGPFVQMLADLLPQNQELARFRYLGRINEDGQPCLLVAFIERDGTRQGLAWLDAATKRVLRLRTDVLNQLNGAKFDSFSRDVRFVQVNFPSAGITLWLPAIATVRARFAAGELYTIHRFSDYRADENHAAGGAAGPVRIEEDAFEVLLNGLKALDQGKPADAVAPLREASKRLPDRVEPGFYLGVALLKEHELAGAEVQFRETLKEFPSLAAAHNELGALLFQRRDKAGAVAEFQEALRLDPGNAGIRANLDAAVRMPADQASLSPASDDVTIRVDVRQVLVPVVVTDKQGHHVTGLTQADFKVFEDGVEQKIAAFSSERADVVTHAPAGAAPGRPVPEAADSPKPLATRHTYVICLDMMHTSFGSFSYVRGALEKLFRQEQAGDSRYVVIALGRSLEVIQAPTSDPTQVLETLGGAAFRNLYGHSPKGSEQAEIASFEGELKEVRAACDAKDQSCHFRKQGLPNRAQALAEYERFSTTQFLSEFRFVVEQLTRDSGRRTLVLISDGLLLAPGRIPFGLLEAYFPEFGSTRKLERMQDTLDPIFRLAVKANVIIYTIDSRGLYTSSAIDASRNGYWPEVSREWDDIATDEGLTLSEFAVATGGTAFRNSNDLFSGLERAFADGREYYTLAYVATNAAQDGKFRKIAVRVLDGKAIVSAKRGYWAASQ